MLTRDAADLIAGEQLWLPQASLLPLEDGVIGRRACG